MPGITFKTASSALLVEASKAMFSPDDPDERAKFWQLFSVRSLKIFGTAITDELSLMEHWDKDKALACFKSVCAAKKFRLGKISPKKWAKAVSWSLEATKINRAKGPRRWFHASECMDTDTAIKRCYEFELRTGIIGSSTNPVWFHFYENTASATAEIGYKSILLPDGRLAASKELPIITDGTRNRRTKFVFAGFSIPRESVKKVEYHMYAPEVWAALKYGYYGLCFAEYMASNA